jgi:hypothetical protein
MEATHISLSGAALSKLAEKVDKIGKTALEITVVLKDSERTYRHKFLIYEDVMMSPTDKIIQDCIREARLSFKEMPEDIVIKTSMFVQ